MERPIDVLNNAKGKRVLIHLKRGGTDISGLLQALDLHLNMWLEQAEQRNEDGSTIKLGTLLVRGDNILYVSPEKSQ